MIRYVLSTSLPLARKRAMVARLSPSQPIPPSSDTIIRPKPTILPLPPIHQSRHGPQPQHSPIQPRTAQKSSTTTTTTTTEQQPSSTQPQPQQPQPPYPRSPPDARIMLTTSPLRNSLVMTILLTTLVPLAETPLVDSLVQASRMPTGVGVAEAMVEGVVCLVGASVQGAGMLVAELRAGGGGVGAGGVVVVLVAAAVDVAEARAWAEGVVAGGEGAGVVLAEGAGGEGGVGTGRDGTFVLGAEGWEGWAGVWEEGGLVAGWGGTFVAGTEVGVVCCSVWAWGRGVVAAVGGAEVLVAGELVAFVGTVGDGALMATAVGGGIQSLVGAALIGCLTGVVHLADAAVGVGLTRAARSGAFVVLTVAEAVHSPSSTVLRAGVAAVGAAEVDVGRAAFSTT